MGYIFSAFGWSYVVAQVPGGWLLDRYGSRLGLRLQHHRLVAVHAAAGVGRLLQCRRTAVIVLFALRLLVGVAEAPSFPANARIVAAWFPGNERGTASAFFNSGQYFATVIFAPLMGWIAHDYGWRYVFFVMGALGVIMGLALDQDRLRTEGASFDQRGRVRLHQGRRRAGRSGCAQGRACADSGPKWDHIRQLLSNRMMLGVYLGQYCINTLTYFFLTWFPVYLVKERGLSILQAGFVATLPALCGFIGGVLGGVISDAILRKTGSLTMARKIPIVGGMLLSMSIIACNYVDGQALVVGFMALAFFGKGIGALGWAVVSDTSPREAGGVSGGLFNYLRQPLPHHHARSSSATSWRRPARSTVRWCSSALNALVAAIAYLVIVGKIERVQLRPFEACCIGGPDGDREAR